MCITTNEMVNSTNEYMHWRYTLYFEFMLMEKKLETIFKAKERWDLFKDPTFDSNHVSPFPTAIYISTEGMPKIHLETIFINKREKIMVNRQNVHKVPSVVKYYKYKLGVAAKLFSVISWITEVMSLQVIGANQRIKVPLCKPDTYKLHLHTNLQ